MLKLKQFNEYDLDLEYEYLSSLPENENGFENHYANITREEFDNRVIKELLDNACGVNLKPGYVPQVYYFLWDDNKIVGLFKFRLSLNEHLRKGAGHIGYGISKEYRGKGYATNGLKLLLDIAKEKVLDNEIYMAVHKNNPASLHVQLKNGAYIHHEDEEEYYTRIKI